MQGTYYYSLESRIVFSPFFFLSLSISSSLLHWLKIFNFKETIKVSFYLLQCNNNNNHFTLTEFYYLCYEGAVDLNSIKDWNQRHALEIQIMEFGQIPKQVFFKPHPSRTCSVHVLSDTIDNLSFGNLYFKIS